MPSRHAAETAPVPSILLVDGYPDTRQLSAMLLAGMGSAVDEAEDGAEALGMATCRPPDVAVVDAVLRRIDGYTLCGLLRRNPLTRSTAIVLVTASADAAHIARAVEAGADEVVVKPYAPNTLFSAIDSARRHRRTIPAETI